jgi:serine/threonine-protein phosphatase 6 regulatory ankyrin repeat subunit B
MDNVLGIFNAIENNRIEDIKEWLTSYSEDINKISENNWYSFTGLTPLTWAVIVGRTNIVRFLIEHGADINIKDGSGLSALSWSIIMGYPSVTKLLIEHGADLNAKDDHGKTVLMIAMLCFGKGIVELNYETEIAKHLIEHGADLNARDDYGRTALMCLLEKVEKLAKNSKSYFSAITDEAKDIIKLLAQHGADLDIKNNQGETALMMAVSSPFAKFTNFAEFLIENGADVNIKTDCGSNALRLAVLNYKNVSTNLIECLVEHGVDIDSLTMQYAWGSGAWPEYLLAAKFKGSAGRQKREIVADKQEGKSKDNNNSKEK